MPRLVNNKIEYSGGVKVNAQVPLDDRTVVDFIYDLYDHATFAGVAHFGMTVKVVTSVDVSGTDDNYAPDIYGITQEGVLWFNDSSATNDDVKTVSQGGTASTEAFRNSLWVKLTNNLEWNTPIVSD
jgi:hypothetical protein